MYQTRLSKSGRIPLLEKSIASLKSWYALIKFPLSLYLSNEWQETSSFWMLVAGYWMLDVYSNSPFLITLYHSEF